MVTSKISAVRYGKSAKGRKNREQRASLFASGQRKTRRRSNPPDGFSFFGITPTNSLFF